MKGGFDLSESEKEPIVDFCKYLDEYFVALNVGKFLII
jgi:hypothetical protein